MKKFLILVLILAAAVGGLAFWLGQSAEDGLPPAGETRMEVPNVL